MFPFGRGHVSGAGGAVDPRPLVINAPLCFVISKWGRIPLNNLKDLVIGFFTGEQIYESKELLNGNLLFLKIDGLPPLKLRRVAKGTIELRDRKEIEDLLELVAIVDEKKLFEKIPKYVTDRADLIPSSRICEADFVAIVRKLNLIEKHCEDLQAQLDRVLDSSRATVAAVEKLNATKEHFPTLSREGGGIGSNYVFGATCGAFTSKKNPTISVLPQFGPQLPRLLQQCRDSDLSESEGATGNVSDVEFNTVISRKTHRQNKRARTSTSSPVATPYLQALNARLSMNPSTQPAEPVTSNQAGRFNERLMIGRSYNTNSRLQAAHTLTIPKEVYRISNIDGGFEVKDVVDYLKYIGVRVHTCFDRTPVTSKIKNNKVFRVCILNVDRDKLLCEDNWDTGIVIQRWLFKPKEAVIIEGGVAPPPPPTTRRLFLTPILQRQMLPPMTPLWMRGLLSY